MSKLNNISAIKKMLAGEHRTQTRTRVGGDIDRKKIERADLRMSKEIGETWFEYDDNGEIDKVVTKVGLNGYFIRSHSSYLDELDGTDVARFAFKNCPKLKCTCVNPNRLDEKFRVLRGKCFDCHLADETKMKINGTFNDYAKDILKRNAEAVFKDMDAEVDEMKKQMDSFTDVFEDGRVEKWELNTDPEALRKQIDDQYTKVKENTLKAIENS